MKQITLAAIDLGTNSCRLQIADQKGKTLYKTSTSIKMGEGLHENHKFTDEAIARGIDCFCYYKKIMNEYHVDKYRAIATAACRVAENGDIFIKKVKQQSGINIEVIDSYQEAVLNLKGALLNVTEDKTDYVVVYDIGGGSTEITLATRKQNPEILKTISIPLGSRLAAEKYSFHEYDPKKAVLLDKEISLYTQQFVQESHLEKYLGNISYLATSSVPLRLTHIARNWETYDRSRADGVRIDVYEFNQAIKKVQHMSCEEMSKNVCIGPVRAKIFQPSCVIFSRIFQDIKADKIVVSLKSAVDSIIYDLANGE